MNVKSASVLVCLLAQLLLAGNTHALARDTQEAGPVLLEGVSETGLLRSALASQGISLDEAAARVRRQTGGRIIKAESRTRGGRTVHLIRVLTRDGRVFTVRVDAATGRTM